MAGLAFSVVELSPTLIKLCLPRANGMVVTVALVYAVAGLWDDIRSAPPWRQVVAALVLASPDGLMGLLFGERFTGHPEIVVALCAAMCLFTLWWLGLTALSAEGMGGWVLRSAAGGAFAAGAAMWAMVPRLGPLAAPLVIAGVTAGELGLAVGGGWGRRLAGRSLGLTLGRVGVCLGAAGLAARFVPGIGALLVGPTVYLLLLLATGEINQEDRVRAMALFPALARMR